MVNKRKSIKVLTNFLDIYSGQREYYTDVFLKSCQKAHKNNQTYTILNVLKCNEKSYDDYLEEIKILGFGTKRTEKLFFIEYVIFWDNYYRIKKYNHNFKYTIIILLTLGLFLKIKSKKCYR